MVRHLYDDNLYRFAEPQPSYWEATAAGRELHAVPLDGDEDCEVAVIGGGYTGLSAARRLAREHSIDVRVLEAGHIGWGASGRNGGFCTIGGTVASRAALLRRHGIEELRRWYSSQAEAVELVRTILQEEGIDAAVQGDAELEVAHNRHAWEELREECRFQQEQLGVDAAMVPADEFRARYFDSTEQYGALRVRPAFALHPLRYHLGLAQAAQRAGAALHAHSEVISWHREGGRHVLRTARGKLRSRFVIVAGNGFMPEHLAPALHGLVMPVISAIIVTRPLADEELARYGWRSECPSISARVLLNYFRLLPDKRLLFGGRGHATGTTAGSVRQSRTLARQFARIWPAWRDIQIDYSWHGLICMTRRLTPALARLPADPSVFTAFGYHGNGVNNSTWCGQQLADWLATDGSTGKQFETSLPAIVRGAPPRFPLPSLRVWYLQGVLAALRARDRLR